MKIEDHLRPHLDRLNTIFGQSVEDGDICAALTKALASIAGLERMLVAVPEREESALYLKALQEAQYALLLVSVGNYRHAYSSLRLFFELCLAGVEFGANLRYLKAWTLGRDDIYWARLSDEEHGVMSKNFCALFFPEMADEAKQFRSIASSVYRECSEFVHGNPKAISKLPDTLEFKKETALDWANKLDTMCLVITFVFSVRYLPELKPEVKESVKEFILGQLGHFESIRDHLGGAVGG